MYILTRPLKAWDDYEVLQLLTAVEKSETLEKRTSDNKGAGESDRDGGKDGGEGGSEERG